MIAWILTSSVLILLVTLLRTVLRGKISLRLQYALWLLVLLRLLLPVNPAASGLSILNAVPPAVLQSAELGGQTAPSPPPSALPGGSPSAEGSALPAPQTAPVPQRSFPLQPVLTALWLFGAGVLAVALLLSNLFFARRLRRARRPFETALCACPVYLVSTLPSPCLFGLVHPAIYLTEDAIAGESRLLHILTHEQTHLRHGDHWWNLLRSVALVLHWYNPLVWLAAVLSRRDAELACDEGSIRRLGEGQRLDYGRTLLSMVALRRAPADLFCCATTMKAGKRGLGERITLLARHPQNAAAALVCLLLALSLAVGCTFTGAKPSVPKNPADSALAQDMTLYDCGGVQIGIPAKYGEQLLVETTFPPSETSGRLLSLSEKASVEAGVADGMEGGIGWLFSIDRLTQAQYEQYLCSDRSERASFARDLESYYVLSSATDVQFYRNAGTVDMDSPERKNWDILFATSETICADMIARNDLTPWTDSSFLSREFSYDSPHAYVKYCPYYNFDGSRAEYDTLVLSQPQKQGAGGIWCVERFYDFSGNVYPLFPQTEDGAEAYFAQLQEDCDNGDGDPALLSATGAALRYVRATDSFFADAKATADSFVAMDGVNHAYFAQNNRVSHLVLDLLLEHPVSGEELLACASGFTPDNWGVLGRYQYGSDWWPPLESALKAAALGEGQTERNRALLRLALSYPKSSGPIAEGLCEIITSQNAANPKLFQQASRGFSGEEQQRIQALLLS